MTSSNEPLTLEQRLRAAEANFVQLLEGAPDAVLVHRNLECIYANPAALKLLGRKRDEVVGHSPFDLVPPRFRLFLADRMLESPSRRATAAAAPRRAAPGETEERLLHSSGREIPVEAVTLPVLFEGKLASLVHYRDITARKQLEARLRAADRLASAGLVAAGLAHEINGPLSYALSNLELLQERLARARQKENADIEDIRATIATVLEGVGRAAHVARDVKLFTSPERQRPVRVDIHRVLDSCVTLLGPEIRGRVRVIKRYGDVPPVLGNESRLAQIFLNLLLNAVQALRQPEDDSNEVTVTTSASPDADAAHVIVEIKDTGVGIPAEIQDAIFEPLFTTKPDGTGVGLAMSRSLVADEGGTITCDSKPGRGTTMTVALRAGERAAVPPGRTPRPHASGKRLLVVDDEPRLAATLKMILAEHETTLAKSGRDALEHLRAGETYDEIICDLLMPDVDGIELYQRISREWPGLEARMIFLTGDALSQRTQHFLDSIPNPHLEKPFHPDELLELVDDALAASP